MSYVFNPKAANVNGAGDACSFWELLNALLRHQLATSPDPVAPICLVLMSLASLVKPLQARDKVRRPSEFKIKHIGVI